MGRTLAEEQMGNLLSADQRARHTQQVEAWTNDRIDSLTGPSRASPPSPFYPLSPQPLDTQSQKAIRTIADRTRADRSARRVAQIGTALITSRATLIANQEATVAHSYGQYDAASLLGAVWKQRTRTTATNEDTAHLAIVGQRVLFSQRYSNGEFWTQERVGCQCGTRVGRF